MASSKQVCVVGGQGSGICYAHSTPTAFTTTFYTGSSIMDVDGIAVCIVGTLGHTTCGHTTKALTGSSEASSTEGALHRVGDTGTVIEDTRGSYTATSGSPILDSL